MIYRETIRMKATGFAAYTMPKPCWAVLEFELEPAPRGSGVSYASVVPGKDIMPRYQHQVEQALPRALSQGRLGWQVTDVKITLTGRIRSIPCPGAGWTRWIRPGTSLRPGARSRGKSTDREPRF